MKAQPRLSTPRIFILAVLAMSLASCGRSRRGDFQPYEGGPGRVIPGVDLDPNNQSNLGDCDLPYNDNASVGNDAFSPELSIIAFPSATVQSGEVIFLAAQGSSSQSRFDYSFEGGAPRGISFLDNPIGVRYVRVRGSAPTTRTVTVRAKPTGTTSVVGTTIRLEFTGSGISDPEPNSSCVIDGPSYPYNTPTFGSNDPRVGQFAVFGVRNINRGLEPVITNVWTNDDSERAYFYQNQQSFGIRFNSAGSKTLFIRALIGRTRCDAQKTITVLESSSANSRSVRLSSSSLTWVDTGVSVTAYSSRLQVGVSGTLTKGVPLCAGEVCTNPLAGYDIYPDGDSADSSCKASGGSAFNRFAVIGKIGENGTPFLVGSSLRGTPTQSGRLFLRINTGSCGDRLEGVFTARVGLRNSR